MDEKRLEEIKARHKAVRCDGWPVPNGGLEAHADRGWLLEVIAEAQVAEKAAHPLRVVQARPCIGPWVGSGVVLTRYDAHGLRVGEASENVHTGAWGGWANVAFGAVVVVKPSTREEVTRAVDAVLATWADLDGVPATDALSQARALLQRVQPVLRWGGDVLNGPSRPQMDALSAEIDAFLAGNGPQFTVSRLPPEIEALLAEHPTWDIQRAYDEHALSRASTWSASR